MKKIYCIKCNEYTIQNPKISYIYIKIEHQLFILLAVKCGSNDEKIFEEKRIEILKLAI